MRVRTYCSLEMCYESETSIILMLRPQSGFSQWIAKESYTFTSSVSTNSIMAIEFADIFGNLCQRVIAPVGQFKVDTFTEVEIADKMDVGAGAPLMNIQELPVYVLAFLVPSRYCESDKMGDFARNIVGNAFPGYDQVCQIVNWIQSNVSYIPGSISTTLTALEVINQGYGVCRDLAHIGIALCRSLCIPARMVVGYLLGLEPMDLHSWFEVFVGNRWYTFDPVQKNLSAGRVAVAYGRDAADVAIVQEFGVLPETSTLKVNVEMATD